MPEEEKLSPRDRHSGMTVELDRLDDELNAFTGANSAIPISDASTIMKSSYHSLTRNHKNRLSETTMTARFPSG